MPNTELMKHGEGLIQAAYQQAEATGHPTWRRMSSAVLKNRLLSLTDRQFDERAWGVGSFGSFLTLFPDLVSVDASTHPPTVELLRDPEGEPASHAPLMTPDQRVRPDLWRAILDYSSGRRYAWDGEHATAVADDEGAGAAKGEPKLLPTVDPETYAQWRTEFTENYSRLLPLRAAEALERWRAEERSTGDLPPRLRGLWNGEVKRRVVERLQRWFAEQGERPPTDLVISATSSDPDRLDTEEIRSFVLRCVEEMTRAELESLALPARTAARVSRRERR